MTEAKIKTIASLCLQFWAFEGYHNQLLLLALWLPGIYHHQSNKVKKMQAYIYNGNSLTILPSSH